jgi:hypothetical protein
MTLSFSPEFSLMASCAMWPPSDCRTKAIRGAVSDRLDWTRFVRVAKRHGVLGLVYDGLIRAQLEVPSTIMQITSELAMTLAQENLAMAVEALRLQRLFDDAGVPVVFVKGASLAVLAYGNLALRSAKDIDVLVLPDTLPRAITLITQAGYRRFEPPPNLDDAQVQLLMPFRKDLGFIHQVTGQQIELHWRLFLNPHVMDETSVMAASRIVALSGDSALRTLGEDDLFTYLCVHGALHWWNQLRWLADIGALLAATPKDAAQLFETAKAKGAGRPAAQAMLLCQQVLRVPLPAHLGKALGKTPKVLWLQNTALSAMTVGHGEQDLHSVPFGTTRGSLSTFLLGQGWRYRLTEMRNLMINQTDVLTVPLPKLLWFLYPILRLPLWIWRHATKRR